MHAVYTLFYFYLMQEKVDYAKSHKDNTHAGCYFLLRDRKMIIFASNLAPNNFSFYYSRFLWQYSIILGLFKMVVWRATLFKKVLIHGYVLWTVSEKFYCIFIANFYWSIEWAWEECSISMTHNNVIILNFPF